ncbi:MAG: Peptidase family [Nocardia sp.]|nr:Peptidase family [Nocardia sp.]
MKTWRTVASALSAIVVVSFASAPSAVAQPAHAAAHLAVSAVNQGTWAGYSVHVPATGTQVDGSWHVPEVSCGPSSGMPFEAFLSSRAAPWIGFWGKDWTNARKTWIAQIGTSSSCHSGRSQYEAVAEMFHEGSGGDYGIHHLFWVKPGDHVKASVTYVGRRPDSRLLFNLGIDDIDATSRGEPGTFRAIALTTPNEAEDNATYHAGCIVESDPAHDVNWPFRAGGLAQFQAPILFAPCHFNGRALGVWPGQTDWEMVRSSTDDPLEYLATVQYSGDHLTVTWRNWE